MIAAQLEDLAAAPVDSLEVRWITPGPLETAMREWFARFPAGTETRHDAYLLQPHLQGLSVKLRDGSTLDVKSYLGSPGILSVRCYGRLESWRKWSFPYQPSRAGDAALPGWIIVRKQRHKCWVPLATGHDLAPARRPAPQAGCMVELTKIHVHDQPWWSVGLEATGSAGLLRLALQHAADMAFAQPLPDVLDAITSSALNLGHQRHSAGRDCRALGGPGRAADVLVAAKSADLPVVGSRGHGGFAAVLLGSVGQHCVQHADCPVLIVRDNR